MRSDALLRVNGSHRPVGSELELNKLLGVELFTLSATFHPTVCLFVNILNHQTHDLDHLPAGEDADGGEEDDGYWVGGTQQPVAVKGRRDLLSQLLAQRHPGGRGQLPAIGENGAAEDGAPRGIQGPEGAGHMTNQIQ